MSLYGLFQDVKNEDINRIFNINLKAPIIITKKLLFKFMISKKGEIYQYFFCMGRGAGGSCEAVYWPQKSGTYRIYKSTREGIHPFSGLKS